jgi:hypothetical protein
MTRFAAELRSRAGEAAPARRGRPRVRAVRPRPPPVASGTPPGGCAFGRCHHRSVPAAAPPSLSHQGVPARRTDSPSRSRGANWCRGSLGAVWGAPRPSSSASESPAGRGLAAQGARAGGASWPASTSRANWRGRKSRSSAGRLWRALEARPASPCPPPEGGAVTRLAQMGPQQVRQRGRPWDLAAVPLPAREPGQGLLRTRSSPAPRSSGRKGRRGSPGRQPVQALPTPRRLPAAAIARGRRPPPGGCPATQAYRGIHRLAVGKNEAGQEAS